MLQELKTAVDMVHIILAGRKWQQDQKRQNPNYSPPTADDESLNPYF